MPFYPASGSPGRIDVEAGIATIQIEAAQGFEIARQFLLLVFAIADEVPPRHLVTQLEARDQFVVGESMVADDVDLLNLGGDPSVNTSFRSTRLRGSGVTTAFTEALYLPTL